MVDPRSYDAARFLFLPCLIRSLLSEMKVFRVLLEASTHMVFTKGVLANAAFIFF